jgi:hypothetical protein
VCRSQRRAGRADSGVSPTPATSLRSGASSAARNARRPLGAGAARVPLPVASESATGGAGCLSWATPAVDYGRRILREAVMTNPGTPGSAEIPPGPTSSRGIDAARSGRAAGGAIFAGASGTRMGGDRMRKPHSRITGRSPASRSSSSAPR